MRSEAEVCRAIHRYADTVRRICFIRLKNHSDAEDIFQEVFMKYALRDAPFESDEHERAWLIRVTINACKDILKSFFRSRAVSFDELYEETFYLDENESEVLSCVLELPKNYRDVIYLHYYEGYSAVEIAKILGRKENTVYTWLDRARKTLKEWLGGEQVGE